MAEEQEKSESTGGSIKNIIIGLVSTITLAVGGFITNKLTGGDEKEAPVQQAAPVINIQNNQTQTAGGGGKTVIINKGGEAAKPAAPVKKKEADEFKEKPAAW